MLLAHQQLFRGYNIVADVWWGAYNQTYKHTHTPYFCHFVFFYKGSLRGDAVAQLWTRPQASIIDASFDIEPRIIDLKTNGPTIVSMRLCLR